MTPTQRPVRRAARIAAPAGLLLTALTVGGSLTLSGALTSTPAAAATAHAPRGWLAAPRQNSVNHKVRISGFAFDGGVDRSSTSVRVSLFVDGRYERSLTAHGSSVRYDRAHHIRGRHAFFAVLDVHRKAARVRLQVHAAGQHNGVRSVETRHVREFTLPEDRIVRVARRYLGSRYSYGADGPHAFDCSGYSMFVYRKAHVARLPHNSQAQRHARHMRRISRGSARPGDLVFYLSHHRAYHVSIYAGHGKQYSATDPSRGVEHSRISSRHVIFKTDWH